MIRSIRSFLKALKASSALGRASKLQRQGQTEEALEVARIGLMALAAPFVYRCRPAEGAALASLTVLVEELSIEVKTKGASKTDLYDALAFLKSLDQSSPCELQTWIPYLEERLAEAS